MGEAYSFIIILLIVAVLSSGLTGIFVRWIYSFKHYQLLQNLEDMLEEGMKGTFKETRYDESKLSLVENQMAKYVSECTASAKNLVNEKEHIKQLIADISHQTKTPIANILLYAQLLEEQNISKECRECIQILTKNAEKLNFLITSLVKVSRLETGIIRVLPKEENLTKLVQEAMKQVESKANHKQIELRFIKQNVEEAYFDFKWTLEAISNLLDNAIKYSRPQTTIEIKIIRYELFTRIDIKDEGIGIKEEELGKIFQRFYRSYEVSGEEGVGIGLYLAREIITSQGGYIKVTSMPKEGSTFSVFLSNNKQ